MKKIKTISMFVLRACLGIIPVFCVSMYIEDYMGEIYTNFLIDHRLCILTSKNDISLKIVACLAVLSFISGQIYLFTKRKLEKDQGPKWISEDED